MSIKKVAGFGTLVVLTGILLASVVFGQQIDDWLKLRGYTPSPLIAALATDTTMNDSSRRLFYVQHPELADKTTFNTHCRENEQTIVLGCFISGRGIFLLDVTDERLAGIEEVTAAHELLHAAYERLSSKERVRINALLQKTYESLNNERIRNTVELYRSQDPAIVPNELHSILGTEVRVLPAELEQYYSRYFTDRAKIVGFSEKYEQAFIERRNQIRTYDEQLASLKTQFENLQAGLLATDTELRNQRDHMNSLKSSNQIAAYNEQVPVYNARIRQYNRDVDRLESMIAQYNDIVQKRNAVASEEAELVEAIDSREVVPQQL